MQIGAIVGIVYLVVVRYFISDIATYFAASVKRPVYYTDWASNRTGTDADQLTNDVELQQFLVKSTIFNGHIQQNFQIDSFSEVYSTYLFVFALLREILGGILSTLLLRGSVKRQRTCFLPWLIYTAIVMIGTIIWIIICVVLMPFLYGIAFCAVGIWELCKCLITLCFFSSFNCIAFKIQC